MPDIPNPSAAPRAATAGAKGLMGAIKGHPPIVYGVVAAGGIGFALYLRHQNNQANLATDVAGGPDYSSTPVTGIDVPVGSGGYADTLPYMYPDATQGAWYGGSQPPTTDTTDTTSNWEDLLAVIGNGGILSGGGMPNTTVEVHVPPPAPTPATAAPAAPKPVGVTIEGRHFTNGTRYQQVKTDSNSHGKYRDYKVWFVAGDTAVWRHFYSGPWNGEWRRV